jgi:hypothetical protein
MKSIARQVTALSAANKSATLDGTNLTMTQKEEANWDRLYSIICKDTEWFVNRGAVDLTLQAKSLDPDALKIELVLTGDPYGSSEDDQQAITIRTYNEYVIPVTGFLGCDKADGVTPA